MGEVLNYFRSKEGHPSANQRLDPITAVYVESSTLAEFLSKSAQTAAQAVISNHNVLKLNAEDSRAFIDAILNPAEPNEVLKEAARRYKQEFGNVS